MFVYIVGNVEQRIFSIGVARDPLKHLASIQSGNPYKLSVISEARVPNKNAALMVERLAKKDLSEYAGTGEWIVGIPKFLMEQFENGHYLRALVSKAGIQPAQEKAPAPIAGRANLQRLTPAADRQRMTFEDILQKVEQAYDEEISIDELMGK